MAYNNLNNRSYNNTGVRSSSNRNSLQNRRNTSSYNRASYSSGRNITNNNLNARTKISLDNNDLSKNTKSEKLKENKKSAAKLEDYDKDMQDMILREMKKMEKRRKILLSVFLIIGVVSIFYALFYYIKAGKSEKRWNDIASMVGSDKLSTGEKTTVTATLTNNETKELVVLPKYETLYKSNKKLIGWLKIDDTIIDYPVMQCDNNTYYLDHNFDQQEDKVGTLFLDYQCDVVNGSDNYIIYGHHLQSGKMFSSLEKYEDPAFYEKHKFITFDTIYEEQKFQVIYVFRSRVYNDNEIVFKYYQFINANSNEEFNSYMREMSALSYYDTGITASYGDTLLTLSTCDYQEQNGRFVVVAKKIK